jgi:hypothetical protein
MTVPPTPPGPPSPSWGEEPHDQSAAGGTGGAGGYAGGSGYQPYGQPSGYGQPSPYGPPAPYGAPMGFAPPPATNGLAIASLVVSVISLTACLGATGFIGAILGHVARGQIKRSNDQGAGLALAGIIVGWVGFALCVLGIVGLIALGIFAESHVDDCYYNSSGNYVCD